MQRGALGLPLAPLIVGCAGTSQRASRAVPVVSSTDGRVRRRRRSRPPPLECCRAGAHDRARRVDFGIHLGPRLVERANAWMTAGCPKLAVTPLAPLSSHPGFGDRTGRHLSRWSARMGCAAARRCADHKSTARSSSATFVGAASQSTGSARDCSRLSITHGRMSAQPRRRLETSAMAMPAGRSKSSARGRGKGLHGP